jgi:methylphosphotriester-DNA--protein-cysteine methyltransferase
VLRYEEHAPPAPVASCVACVWTLTGTARAPGFDLILPDGRPELVVHRGDPFRQRLRTGATRVQPRRLIVGQMTGAVALSPGRRVESIGVRFTPAGLSPLCGFPQVHLADRLVAVDQLPAAPLLGDVAEAAAAAPTLAAAIAAIRRALIDVYAAADPVDARVLAAVTHLDTAAGDMSLAALGRAVGASPRWIERRFQQAVGVSPKRLARLVRFRRALAALDADPAAGGATVALDHGFYDQAHFIAEFRAFAGDAPRRFVEHRLAELTRFFVDRRATP